MRQRYYDSQIGRFTRRDTYEGTLNNPVTLHKYLYANANPISFTDPSGNLSLNEIAASSAIGSVLSSITTVVANDALGRTTTTVDIAIAATTGAILGPLAVAYPLFGLTASIGGVGSSGYLLYKIFSNSNSTWVQKTEAVALINC